jgi:hypothetical protein
MYPVAYGHSRRELTPVRLCSVRLSWRQRARPSTTLHEIQICRSRLEYIVCITAGGGPQLACTVARKLYRRSGCATYVMVSRKSGQREGVYEGLPEVCREFLDEGIRDNGLFGWLTKQANGDTQEEHGGERYAGAITVVWVRGLGGPFRARPGRRRRGRTRYGGSRRGSRS